MTPKNKSAVILAPKNKSAVLPHSKTTIPAAVLSTESQKYSGLEAEQAPPREGRGAGSPVTISIRNDSLIYDDNDGRFKDEVKSILIEETKASDEPEVRSLF